MKVSIREMKDRLSEYLRRVGRGETVEVTRRGEVVAEVRAPYGAALRTDPPAGLRRLADGGVLRLGAENDPDLYPVPGRLGPEGDAARLLDEERGER